MIFRGMLAPLLIGGAIGAVPAWFGAHNVGYASAMKEHRNERTVWLKREVTLWHELGAERRTKRELIESVEDIVNVTGKARTRMIAELQQEKERAAIAEEATKAALKRLDYVEETWKDDTVPDAIVCVFDNANCSDDPAAGTDSHDDLAVREPAPG